MPILLLIQVAGVIVVSARASGRLVRDRSPAADRWLIGVVLALAQMVGTAQVLGILHILSAGALAVVHLAMGVAALILLPPTPAASPERGGLPGAATAAVGVGLGSLSLALGLYGRSEESDTVHYHAIKAGAWATSHNLWQAPFTAPGYLDAGYPSNLEVAAAWLVAPIGSDRGIYALNVLWAVMLVLGVAIIARELGAALWSGALAGITVMSAPFVFSTQTHSLSTDTAASAGIVAAMALFLVARRSPAPPWSWLPAGLALGLSAGSKYTAFLPAVGVLASGVLLIEADPPLLRRVRRPALAALVASPLVVFWIVRNWVQFGNPLYPLDLTVGGLTLLEGGQTPLSRYEASMMHHVLTASMEPLRTWASLVRSLMGPVAIVAAAGVIGGLWAGVTRRDDRRVTIVAAVALLCGLAYLITPYTGGGEEGVPFLIASQLRYSLVVIALAAACFAAALPRWITTPSLVVSLAWCVWKIVEGPGFRSDLDLSWRVVAVGGALTALAGQLGVLQVRRRATPASAAARSLPRLAFGAATLIAAAVVLVVWSGEEPPGTAQPREVRAVLAAAHESGPILVVGVNDLRSLLGPGFEGTLTKVSAGGVAGERVELDGAALTAKIEAAGPALVAVGPPSPLLPDDWTPPDTWVEVGRVDSARLYRLPA